MPLHTQQAAAGNLHHAIVSFFTHLECKGVKRPGLWVGCHHILQGSASINHIYSTQMRSGCEQLLKHLVSASQIIACCLPAYMYLSCSSQATRLARCCEHVQP